MIEFREKLTVTQQVIRAVALVYTCLLVAFVGDWSSALLAIPAAVFILWFFFHAKPATILCVVHTEQEEDAIEVMKHLECIFENVMVLDGDALVQVIQLASAEQQGQDDDED